MVGTFATVLFFTMLKEAYEDYFRYKADQELNNQIAHIFDPVTKKLKDVLWSNIKPGEFIKVYKDEPIPADMLCLVAPRDVVYISTVNLDGETNLKERVLPFDSVIEKNLKKFSGSVMCDGPNPSLEFWNGNVFSQQLPQVENCSMKNVLLRGCILKNTDFVYGIVLYVGKDTKILLNAKKPKRKVSNLMKLMNLMLYTVFAF